MGEVRRKYESEFREGAVTIVRRQAGRSLRSPELGIGAGTLGNWVHKDRAARGDEPDRAKVDVAYVRRLERESAEVRMERDVLRRSVVLWVKRRRGERGALRRCPKDRPRRSPRVDRSGAGPVVVVLQVARPGTDATPRPRRPPEPPAALFRAA